jgi:hypothetical protein
MIEVAVNINREYEIGSVQAVRIFPTIRNPEKGEVCLYKLYDNEEDTGAVIAMDYGDGMLLAQKLLSVANYLKNDPLMLEAKERFGEDFAKKYALKKVFEDSERWCKLSDNGEKALMKLQKLKNKFMEEYYD